MKYLLKLWPLLLLLSASLTAQTVYTVESIPNVKLVNNSYVSNPDNILSEASVARINSRLTQLEAVTTVQVAVVAVRSIGDADIFNFAQQLFTLWGIGKSKKDNGLLILLVVDQRTVRFHTGSGLEGVLPDALCKEIQVKNMLPSFRKEDYDGGMLYGVEEVANVLSNETYRAELADNSQREADGWTDFFTPALIIGIVLVVIWYFILYWPGRKVKGSEKQKDNITPRQSRNAVATTEPAGKLSPYPEMKLRNSEWLLVFGIVPIGLLVGFNIISIDTDNHILLFLVALYIYYILTLIYKRLRMTSVTNRFLQEKNYFAVATFYSEYQVFWLWMAILFPFPFLFMYFQYLARKKFFRNHPRNCKSCGQLIQNRLDEKSDDEFLKKNQVFEEELKSVDYDVWQCPSCKSVEHYRFVNRFSKYDHCTACGTKALFLESDRTIESATTSSTGTGEKTYRCKFCHNKTVTTYTIPMKSESSDSSSGGGSSGGSWGGGSSGGGGASSSW
jgi:uncharacterized protein